MSRATGKGGRYAYYRCFNRRNGAGQTGCEGSDINADLLDEAVLKKVSEELLVPERVQKLVSEIAEFRAAGNDEKVKNLEQLRKQASEYKKKISRMMMALAEGVMERTETFREIVAKLESDLQRTQGIIAEHERVISTRVEKITALQAEAVAAQLRAKLAESKPALKKRLVRSFISAVVVSRDGIAILANNGDLAEVVTGSIK